MRTLQLSAVTEWRTTRLGWTQIYGIAIPQSRRMTRLTVRAGPALQLTTLDGEQMLITTTDPETACQLLGRYHPRTTQPHRKESTRTGNDPRPWFGPKRVGWGYRPQTWQGWLTVAVFAAALIGIGLALGH
jgi:hypothetical protein